MSTFSKAVEDQEARTENDMKAFKSSISKNVDLFYKIGASRGKDIIPDFISAYVENPELALRVAQWARDVRGGAGERQLFRDIFSYLEKNDPEYAIALIGRIPEIGRWDDLLIDYSNLKVRSEAHAFYFQEVLNGNKLAAKWAPRKGPKAAELRGSWGLTARQYRKLLVRNTEVVEQLMCANKWNVINFEKVPSLASARYKTAFYRNAEEAFTKYVEKLTKGEAKVNAGAVYPYDIVKGLCTFNQVEMSHVVAQWNALPNYIGDASILPMVDVSGSMGCSAGNSKTVSCMDVAVSLGMYCSEKNTGKFKDLILTFSADPQLISLKGNIVQRYYQLKHANWGMNTNLHKAFNKILSVAVQGEVPQEEMPEILLIMSDMQFDSCTVFDDSAHEMISRKYKAAGYNMPKIVFWNLNSYDNVSVRYDTSGTALVSGFSPAIMKAVLSADMEEFTPESVMLKAIMIDRYALG